MEIDGFGDCNFYGSGIGFGFGIGYGSSYFNGNGTGYGNGTSYGNGYRYSNGYGNGTSYGNGFDGGGYGNNSEEQQTLYHMTPFAYLTYEGYPQDDTFENFAFHLQVEQLVHRRV